MSVLIVFIQKAIVQGICILYGALGEIMTEKSGNLNLGIPGIMYMGGISGLMGAFLYEKDNPDPNALVNVLRHAVEVIGDCLELFIEDNAHMLAFQMLHVCQYRVRI